MKPERVASRSKPAFGWNGPYLLRQVHGIAYGLDFAPDRAAALVVTLTNAGARFAQLSRSGATLRAANPQGIAVIHDDAPHDALRVEVFLPKVAPYACPRTTY